MVNISIVQASPICTVCESCDRNNSSFFSHALLLVKFLSEFHLFFFVLFVVNDKFDTGNAEGFGESVKGRASSMTTQWFQTLASDWPLATGRGDEEVRAKS